MKNNVVLIALTYTILFSSSYASSYEPVDFCIKGEDPYILCRYIDTPIDLNRPKWDDRETLLEGTVCLSKDTYGLGYKRVHKIETTSRLSGISRVQYYSQFVRAFDNDRKKRETTKRIKLVEKSPWFSLGGTRKSILKLDKESMTGSIKMKFWHGGSLFSKAYSNSTYQFDCKYVNQ